MKYSELCEVYEELEKNPSRLKKTEILAEFFKKLKKEGDYGCHNSPPAVILEMMGITKPRIIIGSIAVKSANPGSL